MPTDDLINQRHVMRIYFISSVPAAARASEDIALTAVSHCAATLWARNIHEKIIFLCGSH